LLQVFFDGLTVHALQLVELAENVTRVHVTLCEAIMKLPFPSAERWLFQNVVVQHPLAAYCLIQVWAFALRHAKSEVQTLHLLRLVETASLMKSAPVIRSRVLRIFKGLSTCVPRAAIGALVRSRPDSLNHIIPMPLADEEIALVMETAAQLVARSMHMINAGGDSLMEFANLCRLAVTRLDPNLAATLVQTVQEVYLRSGSQERRNLPHLVSSLAGWFSHDQMLQFFNRVSALNGRCASPTVNMLALTHMHPYLNEVSSWKPLFVAALQNGPRDWVGAFAAAYFFRLLSTSQTNLQPNDLRSLVGTHREFIMEFMSAAGRPRSVQTTADYAVFSDVPQAHVLSSSPPASKNGSPPSMSPEELDSLVSSLSEIVTSLSAASSSSAFQSPHTQERIAEAIVQLQSLLRK
jgi:hypothetical protein